MTFYFEQDECQGPAFILTSTSLVLDGMVVDGEIRYPAGPVLSRAVRSVRGDSGNCSAFGGSRDAAEMKGVPLSSLGLKAPFHVAR
jgi:hypothetical protein